MPNNRLDQRLIDRVGKILKKPTKYISEQISKKANKNGISSEATLILWAKKLGIATKRYENNLKPEFRREVRESLMSASVQPAQISISRQVIKEGRLGKKKRSNIWQWIRDHVIGSVLATIIAALILIYIFKIS